MTLCIGLNYEVRQTPNPDGTANLLWQIHTYRKHDDGTVSIYKRFGQLWDRRQDADVYIEEKLRIVLDDNLASEFLTLVGNVPANQEYDLVVNWDPIYKDAVLVGSTLKNVTLRIPGLPGVPSSMKAQKLMDLMHDILGC